VAGHDWICQAVINASAPFNMLRALRKLGAAMTANVITYRGRSAAREIGKALSFDPETLARLASLVGAWEYKDEHDTLNTTSTMPASIEASKNPQVFELCVKVQDCRGIWGSTPVGWCVPGATDSVVPLEPATMPGRVVVQWTKKIARIWAS